MITRQLPPLVLCLTDNKQMLIFVNCCHVLIKIHMWIQIFFHFSHLLRGVEGAALAPGSILQIDNHFLPSQTCSGSSESDTTTSAPENHLSVQTQANFPFILKQGAKQLYMSHVPLLPLLLPCGPTSALIISNPGLRHHLIIIYGQWDTIIALSTPLDWRCKR